MFELGQDIDIGQGLRATIQEDEQGNLFYVNPISKNKTIVVPGMHRQDLIGGQTPETGMRYFDPEKVPNRPGFVEDQGNILGSLLERTVEAGINPTESAHNSIDNLMVENELTKTIKQTPGVSTSGGPLDSIGNTLAEYLIGQNPETGKIPEQEDAYNTILNLFKSFIK